MGNVLECSADPLELEEEELGRRARALQGPTRLSASLLFDLNRECYAVLGPRAYVDGIVPHYVSNSAFVAKAYATVRILFVLPSLLLSTSSYLMRAGASGWSGDEGLFPPLT